MNYPFKKVWSFKFLVSFLQLLWWKTAKYRLHLLSSARPCVSLRLSSCQVSSLSSSASLKGGWDVLWSHKGSINNEITRLSDGPAPFHLTLDSPVNLRHFVDWSLLTVCSFLRRPTRCKRIEMWTAPKLIRLNAERDSWRTLRVRWASNCPSAPLFPSAGGGATAYHLERNSDVWTSP